MAKKNNQQALDPSLDPSAHGLAREYEHFKFNRQRKITEGKWLGTPGKTRDFDYDKFDDQYHAQNGNCCNLGTRSGSFDHATTGCGCTGQLPEA